MAATGFVADYLGPERDRPSPPVPTRPARTYIICSTPRSGSGLLCRALAGPGVLGTPLEYLNSVHRGILTERWRCGAHLRSYIAALHARRTSAEGLFGIKVHWEQLVATHEEASREDADREAYDVPDDLLRDLLPNPMFVRILRMDVDAQAVSLWRALHSNVWSVALNDPSHLGAARAPYRFDGIDGCRRSIETGEACWDRLLRRLGVEAHFVTYEQLTSTFSKTVADVVNHIHPGIEIEPAPPHTRRMADEWSMRLLDRFRSERAGTL
jgi:LPS sulfotransferase NodH